MIKKKPKHGEKITYTGYVMHNGQFIGFNNQEFDVVDPGPGMITRDTIHLMWMEDEVVWSGWIPLGAYRHQIRSAREGFTSDESHVMNHPAWKKHLPTSVT
jgi:hypothetical protein